VTCAPALAFFGLAIPVEIQIALKANMGAIDPIIQREEILCGESSVVRDSGGHQKIAGKIFEKKILF
jgi:hypothetical protein